MTTIQMKYFIELAKCLNFTETAMRLYISQPSLSRNISAIESELDVQLFTRGNIVCLTPAGQKLLHGLEPLYNAYLALTHEVQLVNSGITGCLNLGVLEYQNLPAAVMDVLDELAESHPEIKVNLSIGSYSELKNQLHNNELDLAITLALDVEDDESLTMLTIDSVPLYLVVPSDHRLAYLDKIVFLDICRYFPNERFLIMSPQDSEPAANALLKDLKKLNLHPEIEYAQTAGQLALWVISKRGVTMLNSEHIFYHNPSVKFILIEDIPPTDTAVVWTRKSANPVMNLFLMKLSARYFPEHGIDVKPNFFFAHLKAD